MSERTDRELLELAAKAAGIKHAAGVRSDGTWWWYNSTQDREGLTWNPLTDDGDVARLEVSCELQIDIGDIGVISERTDGIACFEQYANHNGDRNSARRRASVRAAAEIGANMQS